MDWEEELDDWEKEFDEIKPNKDQLKQLEERKQIEDSDNALTNELFTNKNQVLSFNNKKENNKKENNKNKPKITNKYQNEMMMKEKSINKKREKQKAEDLDDIFGSAELDNLEEEYYNFVDKYK